MGDAYNPLLRSCGFSLLLQLKNMRAKRIEPLFGNIAKQGILTSGYGRSDLGPILRLECLKGGREKIAIFHHHVTALVVDESRTMVSTFWRRTSRSASTLSIA